MDVTFVFKTVIDVAFAVILCAWAIAVARLTKNGQIENVLKTSEEIAKVAAVVVKAANELDITGELIKTGKTKAEYALEEAKKILGKARKEKLPIVDDDFHLKGLITIKDIEKQIKYPLSAKDEQGRLLCGAGVGITANMMERIDALVNAHVDVIVVDSAHGHSANIIKAVRQIKGGEFRYICQMKSSPSTSRLSNTSYSP